MSTQGDLKNSNDVPPKLALLQMITGFWVSQAIYVAAKLGIADLLKDGPKSSDELAKSAGASPRELFRLLRFLASVGIFAEVEDGCFELTPLAACLQTGVPGSLRALAIMYGEDIPSVGRCSSQHKNRRDCLQPCLQKRGLSIPCPASRSRCGLQPGHDGIHNAGIDCGHHRL